MSRFKPVRVGIIGLWDYADQELRFADGRLVLRGPNGSGKTKALEVLFPFVLDGNLDARRLDPFSGEDRTMKSNLLYGGESAGHGYVWMELARGAERVTIGVGLQVKDAWPSPRSWFFVTDRVRGRDLALLTDDRRPLGRRALQEELGDGAVFEKATDYRRAVDARLFGLGPDRYDAMLDLLLTLRRPQLAKGLDPDRLSDVLTEGLRPLDDALLTDSAQAFEDLERVQLTLQALERAANALDELLTAYRQYLRSQAAVRLAAWQGHDGGRRRIEGELALLERRIARETQLLSAREAALVEARGVQRGRIAEKLALEDSEAYAAVKDLGDLRAHVTSAKKSLDDAVKRLERSQARRDTAARSVREAAARLDGATKALAAARVDAAALARATGVRWADDDDPAALRPALTAREADVGAVIEVLAPWERAISERDRAEGERERASARWDEADDAVKEAQRRRAEALDALHVAIDGWLAGLAPGLGIDGLGEALHAAADGLPAGRSLGEALVEAWAPVRDGALADRAAAVAALQRIDTHIHVVEVDIADIRAERDDAPPPQPTRPAPRDDRGGAPLWRLVRFRDDLPDADRAGLEGALEAAGLLDAWLDPVAVPRPDETSDAFLVPGPAVDGPSLRDLLEPEAQDHVEVARIDALLRSLSLSPEHGGFGADGRFRIGPLAGRFVPDAPRYIGATARAARRARRIADKERELAALRVERAAVSAGLDELDARLRDMRAAASALPDGAAVRAADAAVAAAVAVRTEVKRALDEVTTRRDRFAREANALRPRLLQVARERDLPHDREKIEQIRRDLGGLRAADDALGQAVRQRVGAGEAHVDAEAAHVGAAEDATREEAGEHEARGAHDAVRRRLDTLEGSRGAEAQRVLADIDRLASEITAAEVEIVEEAEAIAQGREGKVRLEAEAHVKSNDLEHAVRDAAAALARLAIFESPDLAGTLELPGDDRPLPARLEVAVGDAPTTEEWRKTTTTRLENRLHTLDVDLGSAYRSARALDDDVVSITIDDGESRQGPARFGRRLREQLDEQRMLLTQQERALFEDQLLGALCNQLHGRIGEARGLVRGMDRAMRDKRLSSGQTVGIRWEVEPDVTADRKGVLELLDREVVHLATSDLERIRLHFAEEVRSARRDHPDRPYLAILRQALDYRRLHRFALTLYDRQGGGQRLTKRVHAKLSGGEKAATLHLPLFAAANAYYTSASSHAPRIVALDEAFAGIDETGVPQLLALTAEFDLDLFMTGYDLWATEPCLPQVAHYELLHDPDERVVSALLVLWNGRETVEGDEAEQALAQAPA